MVVAVLKNLATRQAVNVSMGTEVIDVQKMIQQNCSVRMTLVGMAVLVLKVLVRTSRVLVSRASLT